MCSSALFLLYHRASRADSSVFPGGRNYCTGLRNNDYYGTLHPFSNLAGRAEQLPARRGDSTFVAVTSLLSIAVIRPILTYVLCYPLGLGLAGAWISLVVDQGFRFLTGYVRFSGGKWSKINL